MRSCPPTRCAPSSGGAPAPIRRWAAPNTCALRLARRSGGATHAATKTRATVPACLMLLNGRAQGQSEIERGRGENMQGRLRAVDATCWAEVLEVLEVLLCVPFASLLEERGGSA
eukprot:2779350-Pleurochrysis_carterae.AAC.1